MRKIFSMCLVVALALLCFSGCKEETTVDNSSEESSIVESSIIETEIVDSPVSDSNKEEQSSVQPEETVQQNNNTPTTNTNDKNTENTVTTEPETKVEHTHEYSETILKEATCFAKGEKKFTCACGHSYKISVPALEKHNFFFNGSMYECKDCGGRADDDKGTNLGYSYW